MNGKVRMIYTRNKASGPMPMEMEVKNDTFKCCNCTNLVKIPYSENGFPEPQFTCRKCLAMYGIAKWELYDQSVGIKPLRAKYIRLSVGYFFLEEYTR